jgi:hypothetical protein
VIAIVTLLLKGLSIYARSLNIEMRHKALKPKLGICDNDRWTMDDSGFLHCDNHIYVPESNDLRLCVLQNTHDHPLSGHFSQNHTLELI